MKTPLTAKNIQSHFQYSWWKYLLLGVIGIMGWNLFYTMTAYRPPEEKKVVTYIYAYGDQNAFDALLAQAQQEVLPDMEDVSCVFVTADETYGVMALTTYIYAREGDLFLLPKDEYQSYAG